MGCEHECERVGSIEDFCEVAGIKLEVHGDAFFDDQSRKRAYKVGRFIVRRFKWVLPGPWKVALTAWEQLFDKLVETGNALAEKLRIHNMKVFGVDFYLKLSWEECAEVRCWIFWKRLAFVEKEKWVLVPVKPRSSYGSSIEKEAWDYSKLVDPKSREELSEYIDRFLLRNCPSSR
jgi:hypothetical protein